MKFTIFSLFMFLASSVSAARYERKYNVEKSFEDQYFIINGEVFEAQTYCFNVEEDDKVIFTKSKPNGVCISAEFINLKNGRECKVWCK